MLRLTTFCGLQATALALAMTSITLLAAPAPDPKAKPESAAQKVRKALDEIIDFEATDQTLNSALNQLHDQTKVTFTVDTGTLAQMGLDPNALIVSAKKQSTKGRNVLRSFLQHNGLAYAILGDNVLITSEDMALNRQFKQRVNIDVEKVSLEKALKDLAKETVTNLLIDKRVAKEAQAEVSLQFDDVPFETVVRLLCEQTGLKPVRMGNVLYITSNAIAKELRSEPELAPAGVPGVPGGLDIAAPPGGGGIGVVPGRAAIPIGVDAPATTPADPTDKKPEEGDKKPPEKK